MNYASEATLTEDGRRRLSDLARQQGISEAGAMALLEALQRGHGTMAQFDHPALGGMGQWSRNGMTQIGEMGNDGLRRRVAGLATDLADCLARRDLFAEGNGPTNYTPDRGDREARGWWPSELGEPSATGGQNEDAYALFAERHRLAVRTGGTVRVYDTGGHRIGGFSQQSGGGATFESDGGTVMLKDLRQVS